MRDTLTPVTGADVDRCSWIAPDGRVIHVFKRPKTDRHAEEILAKLPA